MNDLIVFELCPWFAKIQSKMNFPKEIGANVKNFNICANQTDSFTNWINIPCNPERTI